MLSTSPQIGPYKIQRTIGRGTFGKVKIGIHTITNQPVAIKILEKNKIKDVTDVERVSRELHILKQVRHSSIAQLYQIVESQTHIFMVMEYASQGQFFDYIMDRKCQAQAHYYFSQILAGLEYMHNRGIAHRDVKPENMLLDIHKRVKIVDFGLSNMYLPNQKLNTACGSPCYASPQMIKGQSYDPELTDVWSLGVVLFTILMAKLPFEDDNTTILYNKIKSGLYIIDRKVSPQFKDLISKLINTKPQNRLKLRQIKKHPWYLNFQNINTFGINIGFQRIPIDQNIIKNMQIFGYPSVQTKRYLQCNIQNQCTAMYYLFLKKQFKAGRDSLADISSNNFDKNLLKPIKRKQRNHSLQIKPNIQTIQRDIQKNLKDKKQRKCASQIKNIYIQTSNFLRSSYDNSSFQRYSHGDNKVKKIDVNNLSLKNGKTSLNRSVQRSRSKNLKQQTKYKQLLTNYTKQQRRLKTQYIREIYIKDIKKSPKKQLDLTNMFWKKKKNDLKGSTKHNEKLKTKPSQKSVKKIKIF